MKRKTNYWNPKVGYKSKSSAKSYMSSTKPGTHVKANAACSTVPNCSTIPHCSCV